MKLRLIRNATQQLILNGKRLLIDPMLARKGAYPAFPNTGNENANPVADLPLDEAELQQLLDETDAVLLTHLHLDHWDTAAQQQLRKDIPILCQPADMDTLKQAGFTQVTVIDKQLEWEGITIHRTGGRHGTGEIGARMGTVSGYVLIHKEHRLYIAGDTIWCDEVRDVIDRYRPYDIVVNGGGARFVTGDPIVMNTPDILTLAGYATQARIYVVHLESVNHSRESRLEIRAALQAAGHSDRCFVPDDGAVFIDV